MTTLTMTEKLHDCRDAFVAVLERLGAENSKVVAVCNDSVGSSKLGGFKSKWPDRLVNVGIAEQNMVGVGAGLANGGLLPFVCGASCFLTGRSLEQVKADIAYSNANVKLVGISSGMAYGELGPTHHSIEDFAWMRVLPNLPVIAPCDSIETAAAVEWAARYEGPVFLRLSRVGVPDLLEPGHVFEMGKANRLRDGDAVTLIANGTLTHRAMKAAKMLAARGIEARVLNMATVRPIDVDSIVSAARETGAILTAEEHSVYGGLGSAVAEVVVAEAPVPMKILGVPGIFAPTGSAEFLLDEFGMSPEAMATAAEELLARKAGRA
ncbi:transketolase family protein [Agrobacterium sp. ES01]|uniref:transketolase family protein n=1 Tax=Agrobacterium sp. ES01 TaxID=3420714 RepID=UPI003D125503